MATQDFNRPPRIRPHWPAERVELPAPPPLSRRNDIAWVQLLLPLAGAAIFAVSAGFSSGSWLIGLPMGIIALLGVGAAVYQSRRDTLRDEAEYAARRALFEDQVAAQRGRLRRLHEDERAARLYLAPEPNELLHIAAVGVAARPPQPRLWERRIADDDFLELRAGCGSLAPAYTVQTPPSGNDAAADRRLQQLAAEHMLLHQVPICIPMAELGSLGIAGPRPAALSLLHALIWQMACLHGPGDLRIAAVHPPTVSADWAWLRWLPHSVPLNNDSAYVARMVGDTNAAIAGLLAAMIDELTRRAELRERNNTAAASAHEPWLVLIVDNPQTVAALPAFAGLVQRGAALRIAVIVLSDSYHLVPEPCAAVLEVYERGARWTRAGAPWPRDRFTPDLVELLQSDQLARRLAAIRLTEAGGSQEIPRSVRLFDLLGVNGPAELSPPRFWSEPPDGAWRSNVPIGAWAEGKPLYLDLGEQAHGPHGIIAGATGAGKSVLLQGIIAALAITHPPERLQLLLIDFKGGAALAMFAGLAHCAGFVTDLEGRMAARAIAAITSELRRRKTLLKQTAENCGEKVENIADYRSLAARLDLPPLPNLLIVVDEFDELARVQPEFVGELVRVVKQGRSLGVHLLLATQQPARAVTDEIRSQLKFFIALRLGAADDSREMILKPDAAFLPTDIPGRAYMRVGDDIRLFQVAQISGPYRAPERASNSPRVRFVGAGTDHSAPIPPTNGVSWHTDLDLLVTALEPAGCQHLEARQLKLTPIWQPPLPPRITLAELPDSGATHQRLALPVGLLDLPQENRRTPLLLDLDSAHLAVIGAPGTGKTTLLRSLALAAAAAHSPDDLWIYAIDSGGHALAPLAELPHVGAVIQAREHERVRRLLHVFTAALRERQDLFRQVGVPDRRGYVAQTQQPLPALLLLIDKIAVLREELPDHEGDELIDTLLRLARAGRSAGIHIAVGAERTTDLSYRLLAMLELRLALRLPDLHEYADLLGGRVTSQLPADTPGRVLWMHPEHGPLEAQVALPNLMLPTDETADNEHIELLRRSIAQITHPPARLQPPPITLLPERVLCRNLSLPETLPDILCAAVGIESLGLTTAALILDNECPHSLLIGPRRSGKTTTLRTAALSLVAQHPPSALRLLILDGPRGGLAGLRELPHTALYAHNSSGANEMAALLRAPKTGDTRYLLLIDDYHLSRERLREHLSQTYGESNLLSLLLEAAQIGAQGGIHLLIAADIGYADDHLLRALDGARSGMILWPGRYDGGTKLLGVSLPLPGQRNADQPPGRALLIRDGERRIVQVALDEL